MTQASLRLGEPVVAEHEFSISSNPLGLVEIIRDYGVKEFGALFVYLPMPCKGEDREAWAWVELMQLSKAVRGGPWQVQADALTSRMRDSHPRLFQGKPSSFEVYRIDQTRLADLIR